jgi:hypothetical protein
MESKKLYILTFEWSESPYHQGNYRVFLSYNTKSARWILSTSRKLSGERLPWKKGNGTEDPKVMALDLLKKSYDRGALSFDLIADEGPFKIYIEDFVTPKKRLVKTSEPIDAPRRICYYCRHLKWPEGVAALRARMFSCHLDKWTDEVKERKYTFKHPIQMGIKGPNLEFTCPAFAPAFKTKEETYY